MIMNIKLAAKQLVGRVQALRFGVTLRHAHVYIGRGCKIVGGSRLEMRDGASLMPFSMAVCHRDGTIRLLEGSSIGMFSRIAAMGEVTIGRDVLTGPNVFIADYNHEYRDPGRSISAQGLTVLRTEDFPRGGGYTLAMDHGLGRTLLLWGLLELANIVSSAQTA